MSRAVRRQHVGVALFPFLAVLICTMGALIVLLVLLVQQARVDASTIAAGKASTIDERGLRERVEDAQWRRETLETSRAEKTQELSDARGKLAHLEEHLQRLQQRAKELMERARLIDEGSELRADDLDVVRDELARVQAEAAAQKKKIDEARKNAAKESSYALIPYDGPNGTRRRPIYLECTEQGVIVQPEGLVLGAQDFQGPLGPGNPLDATLRMIRAHLEKVHGAKAGQPYPLVVVRPSGVAAYGAARAALKSWDDEFGYELVGDEKRLEFGEPDPALALALEQTVAVARRKQAAMAAMMPRQFQSDEPLPSFAPEPAAAAPANSGSGGAGLGSRVGAGAGGSSSAGSAIAGATSASSTGAYGGGAGLQAAALNGQASGTRAGAGPGPGGIQSSATALNGLASPGTGPMLGPPGGMSSGSNSTQGSGGSMAGDALAASSPGAGISAQSLPPGGQPGGAGGGGAVAPSQAGGQPLPNLPIGQASSRAPNSTPASGATGGSAKGGGSKTGKNRGRNWALTGAKLHSIGVTRPLHVSVQNERLTIVPDQGDNRAPVVVAVSPELRPGDVEKFVAAVQKEVQGWGLAVANGYWKPVLYIDVGPGADQQFANLQSALEGSGFDIVRKQP